MIDIKVLAIHDLLVVTGIEVAKIKPLSLIILGQKLNEASRVFVNDIQAPEFIIASETRILAQVPDSEKNSPIRKISVIAEKPSTSRNSLLSFELGSSFSGLQGIERMVQAFVKLLLQTPGSDKFHPNRGGGLLTLIGRNVTRDGRALQTGVVSAVGRTRDQLVAIQSKNSRIPADERLLTAKTEAVGFNPNTTTLHARVELSATSGRAALANLSF